ncbi:MAG: glycosyltransferase family 4 protein [Bifidobacteriaceae bacterium]|jgi:glycosyltransferase involved in cell wall biosynthesis|nr:glycosyltransferase family 4 protein [Bifidobacteriaceae bacterium]
MRIAVVNNFFPPRVGGSSHLSHTLATRYAQAGHKVLAVTAAYRDAPTFEAFDGGHIVRLPAFQIPETPLALNFDISFATRPSLPRRLARILDAFKPDVIHQHGQFFDLTWASGLYARRRGIPTLLSVHTRLENPTALYRGALRYIDACLVRPALLAYRPNMVVMDRLMRSYITERYPGAYRELFDIPVGIDPVAAAGGDGGVGRAKLGLEPDVPLIVSVGHVIPLRDRVALVEALPHVRRHIPQVKLAVIGEVYYDVFSRRAAELGVSDSVIQVGPVPKADVPHYLAAAWVESHEQGYGLGTATLEAMAAGVPVVAAARPDNFAPLALTDRRELFLAPPGDTPALAAALTEALSNRALAGQVGLAGQEFALAHFTLDAVTNQHLDVLGELAKEASTA